MMKLMMVLLVALASNAYAYQCDHFMNDAKKVETLNYVSQNIYGNDNLEQFCNDEEYLDLELDFIPNYFRYGEENDDHYKMMVHYDYRSCTFIYNITKKHLTKKSCYSTWK